MRTLVEVVAEAGPGATTRLSRLHGEGALAVRATAAGTVHLVGTAAGPLGGDDVLVRVRVGAGARLAVHGVAATIALPGRLGGTARLDVELVVEDDGVLAWTPPPLVVCRGADLVTTTRLEAAPTSSVDLLEQVVLGRHGEPAGAWTGHLAATTGAVPLLRTSTSSSVLDLLVPPGSSRVVVSHLRARPGAPFAPTTHGTAAACPLRTPDGVAAVLVTAAAGDLTTAAGDAARALASSTAGELDVTASDVGERV